MLTEDLEVSLQSIGIRLHGSGRHQIPRDTWRIRSWQRIGNTPLLRLAKVDEDLPGVESTPKPSFSIRRFGEGPGRAEHDPGRRARSKFTKDHVLLDATAKHGHCICDDLRIKGYRAKLCLRRTRRTNASRF